MEFDLLNELTKIFLSIFFASNLLYLFTKFISWLCNVIIGVLYVKD